MGQAVKQLLYKQEALSSKPSPSKKKKSKTKHKLNEKRLGEKSFVFTRIFS
jgi:hypothetical protein